MSFFCILVSRNIFFTMIFPRSHILHETYILMNFTFHILIFTLQRWLQEQWLVCFAVTLCFSVNFDNPFNFLSISAFSHGNSRDCHQIIDRRLKLMERSSKSGCNVRFQSRNAKNNLVDFKCGIFWICQPSQLDIIALLLRLHFFSVPVWSAFQCDNAQSIVVQCDEAQFVVMQVILRSRHRMSISHPTVHTPWCRPLLAPPVVTKPTPTNSTTCSTQTNTHY